MFTVTKFNKIIVSSILYFIFLVGTIVYAGTTGKIAGKITDKSTGEVLIGANVLIVGTTMGASSDIDGNYFILNIPPGEYEVKASMIGYSSFTIQKDQSIGRSNYKN